MTSSPVNRLKSLWPSTHGDESTPAVAAEEVVSMADAWRKRIEAMMGDHPKTTVALAAVAGVALGWFLKRK